MGDVRCLLSHSERLIEVYAFKGEVVLGCTLHRCANSETLCSKFLTADSGKIDIHTNFYVSDWNGSFNEGKSLACRS